MTAKSKILVIGFVAALALIVTNVNGQGRAQVNISLDPEKVCNSAPCPDKWVTLIIENNDNQQHDVGWNSDIHDITGDDCLESLDPASNTVPLSAHETKRIPILLDFDSDCDGSNRVDFDAWFVDVPSENDDASLWVYCDSAQTETEGGSKSGVHVEKVFTVTQNKFDYATDLHFKAWQKEDNIHINGWKITISHFCDATSQRGSQPPPYNTVDDGTHAVDVIAYNGSVTNGNDVTIKIEFWLSNWNTIRLDSISWTKGDSLLLADIPDHGWSIANPYLATGAPKPNTYGHIFTIANDDPVRYLTTGPLSFAWHFDDYPIYADSGLPIDPDTDFVAGVNLGPGESWACTLMTEGDCKGGRAPLYGGHIYGAYTIGGSKFVFDHTVPPRLVPALTNWGLLVLFLLLVASAIYVIYQRRRGVVR